MVAGGARNNAEWAWLTGRRMVQFSRAPLFLAAENGHEAAIKALVAAKADVHAKEEVRGGGAGWARGETASGLHLTIVVWSFWTWGFGKTQSVNLNPKPWTVNPNAFNVRS